MDLQSHSWIEVSCKRLMREQWPGDTTRRLFHLSKDLEDLQKMLATWDDIRMDLHATINLCICDQNHWSPLKSFYLPLEKDLFPHITMLSLRKKSKPRKRSLGFTGGKSGSVSNMDDRVVMLCEDIPSEGSSFDSGQGSSSSGARSSSEELGLGWRSRSFHGREGQSTSSSSRPVKQYSVREVRQVGCSPVYRQNPGSPTLHIRELYESAHTVLPT